MTKSVYKKVEQKAVEIEKQFGSLENYVKTTTPLFEHTLKIEEVSSFQEMIQIYQELKDLEFVDFLDFEKYIGEENGKFD